MAEISTSWRETLVYEEIIYQALRDCPVHLGPDRSYPCLDRLAAGELILALGNGRPGTFHPADTWVQIDLDQWVPLALEGQAYLQRHGLEARP